MSAASLYPVHPEAVARTFTDEATYKTMYQQSVVNPDGFWREQAQRIDWIKPFEKVKQTSFDDHHVDIKWFADGTLNVSHNCLDRHLAERGDQVAIIWEGDDPADHQEITYRQLHEQVCKFANALRGQDVHRGDVVTIYMPMIPEAVVAMLACTRIGAIHSVVFGGFSPEALAGRIIDCKSKVVITADEGVRGGKRTPLKANVDDALTNPETSSVQKIIVCKRTGAEIKWNQHRDVWYDDLMKVAGSTCAPKEMGAEDPLFIIGWKRQVNGAAASLRSVRSRRSPRRRPASVGAPGARRSRYSAKGRGCSPSPWAHCRRYACRPPTRITRSCSSISKHRSQLLSEALQRAGPSCEKGSGLSASADDERENSNMRPPHSNRLALAFSVCGRLGIAPMPGKLSTGMIALPGSPYGYCTQTSIRDVALT